MCRKTDVWGTDTIPIPIYRYRRYVNDIFDISTHLYYTVGICRNTPARFGQNSSDISSDVSPKWIFVTYFGLVWPLTLTAWPTKLTVSCPCLLRWPFTSVVSKLVHAFSKYHVHKFEVWSSVMDEWTHEQTHGRTDERTDGQIDNIMTFLTFLLTL